MIFLIIWFILGIISIYLLIKLGGEPIKLGWLVFLLVFGGCFGFMTFFILFLEITDKYLEPKWKNLKINFPVFSKINNILNKKIKL